MKTEKTRPFDVAIAILASGMLIGALARLAENSRHLAALFGF